MTPIGSEVQARFFARTCDGPVSVLINTYRVGYKIRRTLDHVTGNALKKQWRYGRF